MSVGEENSRAKRLPTTDTGISLGSGSGGQNVADPVRFQLVDETDETVDDSGKHPSNQPAVEADFKKKEAPSSAPSKASSFKRFCRRLYKKFGMKHMITFLMVVVYTIIGAAAFIALEKQSDKNRLQKEYKEYKEARRYFSGNFTQNVTELIQRGDQSKLRELIDDQLRIYDELRDNVPGNESEWNFWNAMYFAGTIYTTIGYGDIYCRTMSGRIFTMFYSLIGIPLMLITLTDLGGVLLKMMLALTYWWESCKAKYSPRALFGPHPPGYCDLPPKHKLSRSDTAEGGKGLEMETGNVEGEDDDVDDLYELEKREEEDYENHLTKVPVTTALLVTIGWIFLCAALFCLWEDWDYFTSVYFFFISLSTIGLGDETPAEKHIMVCTYALVIIGLSLVSMCITVIQRRLEDLYLQLLQLMLQEYQKRLMAGGDQVGATVGMMQAWQKSIKARFLMPLLSKDKKKTVVKKFEDEAKAQGIILPAVLRDLDPRTGIPKILRTVENKVAEGTAQLRDAAAGAIKRATAKAKALNEPVEDDLVPQVLEAAQEDEDAVGKVVPIQAPAPVLTCYDADAQTDELEMEDKQEQTMAAAHVDAQTQSDDSSLSSNLRVDGTSQTPIIEYDDASAQCHLEEVKQTEEAEEQTQTDLLESKEASSQTSKSSTKDQLIQTHIFDLGESESQTEKVEMRNQRLQTPVAEILEQEAQTDPLVLDPEQFQATGTLSMASNKKGWAKAKENLQHAIKKAKTGMHSSTSKAKLPSADLPAVPSLAGVQEAPAMASWSEVVGDRDEDGDGQTKIRPSFYGGEEDEDDDEPMGYQLKQTRRRSSRKQSEESLHWDPFDGLHAEPQRKVGDLKKVFEKQKPGDKRKQIRK